MQTVSTCNVLLYGGEERYRQGHPRVPLVKAHRMLYLMTSNDLKRSIWDFTSGQDKVLTAISQGMGKVLTDLLYNTPILHPINKTLVTLNFASATSAHVVEPLSALCVITTVCVHVGSHHPSGAYTTQT